MKVPPIIVPVLIVLLTVAGLGAAKLISIPSIELDFPSSGGESPVETREATLLVDGVKCVDTAETAGSTMEDLPGVFRFVAYASRNRVDLTYDPAQIDIEQLVEALEGPVFDEESGEFLFGLFTVIEIDGVPVSR